MLTKLSHNKMKIEVEISGEDFNELKFLYNKAVRNNEEKFYYKENLILTSYAKYLVEYLEPKFKN